MMKEKLMTIYREARFWLIRKLAGNSAIILNAEFEDGGLVIRGTYAIVAYNSFGISRGMSERFSHRNGETDPPIENGYFWFLDSRYRDYNLRPEIVDIYFGENGQGFVTTFLAYDSDKVELLRGCWWGPINPPREE